MVENRIFAYIDILGFKKLVKEKGNDKIHAILKKFIESDNAKMNDFFEMISFSDTILVYARKTGFHETFLDDITYFAKEFVIEMLQHEIPVRGVITYGELNIDMAENSNHKMFWGQGLIDAYEAESTENIVGLFMLPEALNGHSPIQTLGRDYSTKYHVKYDDRVLINLFQRLANIPKEEFDLDYYINEYPGILSEVEAFRFLEKCEDEYSGKIAEKYRNALKLAGKFIYHDITELYRFLDKKTEEHDR